jgi:hypothetical protein
LELAIQTVQLRINIVILCGGLEHKFYGSNVKLQELENLRRTLRVAEIGVLIYFINGEFLLVKTVFCCIELKNKLKCALDEVSSLNLVIQLVQKELTSDCVLAI